MRWIVRNLDLVLRRLTGVIEYWDDPQCLFRIQRGRAPRELRLSDGSVVPAGAPVIILHLWNEQLPQIGPSGADLAWALEVGRRLRLSLRALAEVAQSDKRFQDGLALGGVTVLAPLGTAAGGTRLLQRLGFDVMPHPPNVFGRFGMLVDNLYVWGLMWTFNKGTLGTKRFSELERTEIWMSRRTLLERHGRPAETS
jgi:hypothetical protein